MTGGGIKRGALIVLEGCDRAGKTTQCRKLVDKLGEIGIAAQMMQFPGKRYAKQRSEQCLEFFADRMTATGKIISNYLTKQEDLPDQAVHLLFSANRWENQPKMKQLLHEGVTLVVDRYSYSGVAYSAAKPGLNFDWCYKPEIGLPKPDLVFFLHLPPSITTKRSGFGEERYEEKEFLQNVYENYLKMKQENWLLLDATRSVEELHNELLKHSKEIVEKVKEKELGELW